MGMDGYKNKQMMKKFIVFIGLLACVLAGCTREKKEFTVLQWNIWQEGTKVEGGYDAIVNEIVRLQPDFVTFSEVRNYHNTNFTARLTASLKEKGLDYYSFYSYDSGLLSKYPITDSVTVFPEKAELWWDRFLAECSATSPDMSAQEACSDVGAVTVSRLSA